MKNYRHIITQRFCLLLIWLQTASLSPHLSAGEAQPYRVPRMIETARQEKLQILDLDRAETFRTASRLRELGGVAAQEIAQADLRAANEFRRGEGAPVRVGLARPTGLEGFSLRRGHGFGAALPDGNRAWVMALRSPGATSIRLHFTRFAVGTGSAVVYARTAAGTVMRGPYKGTGPFGRGEFWSESVPGDTVFVEVKGHPDPDVEIGEIMHADRAVAAMAGAFPGVENPCHRDVMCLNSAHPIARDATAQLSFVKSGSGFICTGTLLNDLDTETRVPYMLTAFHCISSQAVADTLEAVYLFQSDGCDGAVPDPDTLPRSLGASLLELNPTDGGNDMCFLRLRGDVPGGVTLAGWTTAAIPNAFVGIHHPNGSFKRGTIFAREDNPFSCPLRPPDQYLYGRITAGMVEGGSSGSAVFNDEGQVLGQLYGRCNVFGDNYTCADRDQFRAIYGRFSVTFPLIDYWLSLGGTLWVNTATPLPPGNGTRSLPYQSLTLAHARAWDGAHIKIVPGRYRENLVLSKQVTLFADGGSAVVGE